jgi:hypothetical protein
MSSLDALQGINYEVRFLREMAADLLRLADAVEKRGQRTLGALPKTPIAADTPCNRPGIPHALPKLVPGRTGPES